MSYSRSKSAALRRTSASRSLGSPPNFFAALWLHSNRTSAVTVRDESSLHRNATDAPTMTSRSPAPHSPPAQYITFSVSSSPLEPPTSTSTSSKSPDSIRVRTSASMSSGDASIPGLHRSMASSSSGDAPGSGRSVGIPSMVTELGITPGGRGPGASGGERDPLASTAAIAAPARSEQSSSTTASGR